MTLPPVTALALMTVALILTAFLATTAVLLPMVAPTLFAFRILAPIALPTALALLVAPFPAPVPVAVICAGGYLVLRTTLRSRRIVRMFGREIAHPAYSANAA